MTVAAGQRFTRQRPCPVCSGYETAPRGQQERCYGFMSDDGRFANCTRDELAGGLPQNTTSDTYPHTLNGDCKCGVRHDQRPASPSRDGAQPLGDPVDISEFTDEHGRLLYQEVRYSPKSFRVRRPDGNGGWKYNLGSVRRVLSNLVALTAADPAETVWVVEGSKDAKRLISDGLLATTNALGAKRWDKSYSETLDGRQVVIVPDNDGDGRDHAQLVARSLFTKAMTIKVLELPGLPEKGDVSDWLDAGGTVQELRELAAQAPPWRIVEGTGSDEAGGFKAQPLDDLLAEEDGDFEQNIVIGDSGEGALLSIDGKMAVAGATGVGKTNLLLYLSRRLGEASPFLGLPIPTPRTVLYALLEGSKRNMRRRIRKEWAGSDSDARRRFFLFEPGQLDLTREDHLRQLDFLLYQIRPDVLVIDALRYAHPLDENSNTEMPRLTAILDGIISRHHCAIILAHHDRKRPPLTRRDSGIDRVRGASAFTGWLSACLTIDVDPAGPDRLVVEFVKTRDAEAALAPLSLDFDRETLGFTITDRTAGGKVPDDAILTAIFHEGGSVRGPDFIRGFAEGAAVSTRWMRERLRDLVKDGQLIEYVAPEDKRARAKSYALPDSEPVEVEL